MYMKKPLPCRPRTWMITIALLFIMNANGFGGEGWGLFRKHQADPTTHNHAPAVEQTITLEELARHIDELDRELFRMGVVTVKSPDVWGQNSLTRYRSDYDKEMTNQLDKFQVLLNGAMRRTDVAAFTSATSVGAAIQPGAGGGGGGIGGGLGNGGGRNRRPRGRAAVPAVVNNNTTHQSANPSSSSTSTIPIPTPGAEASALLTDIAARLDKLQSSVLTLPSNIENDVKLEPNIQLDELSSYLNHLNELRRINTGDDLIDIPGYALYVVRMPVSLLPGPSVREGKGAIVTAEATHILPDDLLEETFRDVIIMDSAYILQDAIVSRLHAVKLAPEPRPGPQLPSPTRAIPRPSSSLSSASLSLSELADVFGEENLELLTEAVRSQQLDSVHHDPSVLAWLIGELSSAHEFMREQAAGGRLAPLFQSPQFDEFDQFVSTRDLVHLQKFRTNFLNILVLMRNGCSYDPALYFGTKPGSTDKQRETYVAKVACHAAALKKPADVLIFALMLQSVLVDRQLRKDVATVLERQGLATPVEGLRFRDLIPAPEAKDYFNNYVAAKWPLHVFTLDPMVDQQNKLDVYSARSELQLALAVAVSTGQVKADNATKFARQIDTDLVTIGLNPTAVGFSAGETTFGWKFFPRMQSPPSQSNLGRITGLLINGGPGPNNMEKHVKIEPGPRECVSIIVAPDFVPEIELTTISNWFQLTGSHASEKIDSVEALALSRKVQQARWALGRICDTNTYRPGELKRLEQRLTQLEAMLPTQTYRVRLPDEGDLLGSEIFSSNHVRLEPRLIGWYGEVPRAGTPSRVFLLGKGFSIKNTQVIIGGLAAKSFDLMSRNVIAATLDENARLIETIDGRLIFDAHIATHNGISNHLLIEADRVKEAEPESVRTTVSTITKNKDGTSTTETTIESTPWIRLPSGTVLPLSTQFPPGTSIAPWTGQSVPAAPPKSNDKPTETKPTEPAKAHPKATPAAPPSREPASISPFVPDPQS